LSAIKENRLGQFEINVELLDRSEAAVIAALHGCLIVRAERLFHKNVVEYIAYAKQFRPAATGEIAPFYEIQIRDLIGGKYHVEFNERKKGL
jgi:hypothetical protein